MRKPRLAALAGLLALAAAVPAAADPVRLDEAALGGVAAGANLAPVAGGIPNLSVLDLTSATSTTDTRTSVSSQDTIAQMLRSETANSNYATGINADTVGATGNALSTVTGSITPAAPR